MPETYNEESIQQILKIAMSRQGQSGDLTRSQLQEIADELGISEDNLIAAEQDWDIQQQEREDRQDFNAYRHLQLHQGLVRCLVISLFLVLSNLIMNHRISWSVYPIMVWSFFLSLQAWRTYQQEGEDYDRAFRRWKLGQQIGQSFKAITERIKDPSATLGNKAKSNSSNPPS